MLNMKTRVYTLLALSFFLTRCSEPEHTSNPHEEESTRVETNESVVSNLQYFTIISPSTGEELQVADRYYDYTFCEWDIAKEKISNIGDGWRLPTKAELVVIYKELHLKGKGAFSNNFYWSDDSFHVLGGAGAFALSFEDGTVKQIASGGSFGECFARPVRPVSSSR
jgi:hypothetical protein